MKNLRSPFLSLFITASIITACGYDSNETSQENQDNNPIEAIDEDNTISMDFIEKLNFNEPVSYMNLQIFMISGKAEIEDGEYIPLNKAMEKKYVKIKETSNVNELEISNTSDETIFINASDIIKGGKQDRTLAYDMIVEAGTKKQKLSSFCVEHDRWSKRGLEDAAEFSSNTKMLSSRELKISSKKDKEQAKVWAEVENTQNKLSQNVSYCIEAPVDVKANASSSSLELALDNKELKELKEKFLATFKNILKEEHIGFAYAINGELYTVDVYNNKELFDGLFEKLLNAAIVEAIAELDPKATTNKYISIDDVRTELRMDADFEESKENLNDRTRWITQEDSEQIIFTTLDKGKGSIWVHRNIIIKDKNKTESEDDDVVEQNIIYNQVR
ncbi:MAG: hypothetical protein H6582_00500 [Crocinitomicaceae bacterium]|nr:hypothetical protein [Crocinitomicaceae bacterium]